MSFSTKDIAKCLEGYNPTSFEYGMGGCVLSVALLSSSPAPLCRETIYIIASPADLTRLSQGERGLRTVACFSSEAAAFDLDDFCRENELDALFLALSPSTETVYSLIYSALRDNLLLAQFSRDLLDMLFHDGSVQKMVDLAYGYLENPIVVFDAGLHLIAVRWDSPNMDEHTERLIRTGHLEKEDIKMMNYNNIHERVKKSSVPVLVQNKKYKGDRIIAMLNNKKDLGQVSVVEVERPFKDIDYKLMDILRNSIAQQVRKDEFIRHTKGFNYEYFLKDLLDGKFTMSTDISKRVASLDKEFSDPIYCLVFEIDRTPGAVAVPHIRSSFEALLPGISTIVYNGQIVAIVSGRSKSALKDDEISVIERFCTDNELFCGMSNAFKSITNLLDYYSQAMRAIQFGAGDSTIPGLFAYSKHFIRHVAGVFLQKENAVTFCCPQIKQLVEHDKTKGKDLAKTLYMYLLHGNANVAASAMFIHRNTMLYRMRLINELVSVDYEDPMLRQYIILSYEMMSN